MKILIDPKIFNMQLYGGISRYHSEIYRSLKSNPNYKVSCPLVFSENLHLRHLRLLPLLTTLITKWGSRQKREIQEKLLESNIKLAVKALKSNDYDVFIPTYYDPYFLEYCNKPFVLTVYDMIHELFPQYYPTDDMTAANKDKLLEKASRIIAISQSTKNDILKLNPSIPEQKIHVVYLSHSIRKKDLERKPQYKDYVLFVGNRIRYKNFEYLVNRVSDWLKQHKFKLICAGGGKFNHTENNLLATLGLTNLVIQHDFLDYELASYYKGALAFIFPSEYEGFGIPVLEAMFCGCPVILPSVSSFPEVAGDAGLYFDLNDNDALPNILSKLKADSNFRDEIILKGYKQEKQFSWDKTAKQCIKIFKDVQS